VTVRAQQDVDFLNIFLGVGTHGIVHDPRIDNDGLPCGSFDAEGRMPQPRKLDAFQIHFATNSSIPATGAWQFAFSPIHSHFDDAFGPLNAEC
jgi:hypothetical protein